jgi:endonuclease/exonuclease/phosphatase family metal-dependent hydrolase
MLIDGNDAKGEVFSRDCPEYTITTPSGDEVVVLVNHLKSKGFGQAAANDAKRKRQATRVAAIYKRLRKEGQGNVVVLGDFRSTTSCCRRPYSNWSPAATTSARASGAGKTVTCGRSTRP